MSLGVELRVRVSVSVRVRVTSCHLSLHVVLSLTPRDSAVLPIHVTGIRVSIKVYEGLGVLAHDLVVQSRSN